MPSISQPHLNTLFWIFLFLTVYWGICIFFAIQGIRRTSTLADYSLANKRIGYWGWTSALTASTFSGWTIIDQPALVYAHGWQAATLCLTPIIIPITGILFFKRIWWLSRKYRFMTPGEMLNHYYQQSFFSIFLLIATLLCSIPMLAIQLKISGLLFHNLTNGLVSVEFGMWVLSIVVMAYAASGGLWTISRVNGVQLILMVIGLLLVTWLMSNNTGGWKKLFYGIAAVSSTPNPATPMATISPLLSLGILASPAFMLWAFASRSPAPFSKQHIWISGVGFGLLLIMALPVIGFGGRIMGAVFLDMDSNPDSLIPQIIPLLTQPYPWLVGLLTIVLLAAMESTAATAMTNTSTLISRDLFYHRLLPNISPHSQKFIARMLALILVGTALLIASSHQSTVIMMTLAAGTGLQLLPTWLALCYFPFISSYGIVSGFITGMVVIILTLNDYLPLPLTQPVNSPLWGAAANLLITLVVSWCIPGNRLQRQKHHDRWPEPLSHPQTSPWLPILLTIAWIVLFIGPTRHFAGPLSFSLFDIKIPGPWLWLLAAWVSGIALLWLLAEYYRFSHWRLPVRQPGDDSA